MDRLEIVEVGPRDGLQNEAHVLPTADKIELIRRLVAAGVRRIEVASFVNPRKVPQMADAEAVVAGFGQPEGITRIGLVLNAQGGDRALAAGVDQLGAVAVASDAFAMRNQGQTSEESVSVASEIIAAARRSGKAAQATIAVAFGCPFAGPIDPHKVVAMARQIAAAGAIEVALADTVGVAVPRDVTSLVRSVRAAIGPTPIRVHFHDTRGTGIANVWAAVEAGATVIDSALGGLGGCPFAPGAAGNVATEDVVHLLQRSEFETGLHLSKLLDASHWLGEQMGKELPSKLGRSGPGPLLGELA